MSTTLDELNAQIQQTSAWITTLRREIARVIVRQRDLVDRLGGGAKPRQAHGSGVGVPPAAVPTTVPAVGPNTNRDGWRDGGSRGRLPHYELKRLVRAVAATSPVRHPALCRVGATQIRGDLATGVSSPPGCLPLPSGGSGPHPRRCRTCAADCHGTATVRPVRQRWDDGRSSACRSPAASRRTRGATPRAFPAAPPDASPLTRVASSESVWRSRAGAR